MAKPSRWSDGNADRLSQHRWLRGTLGSPLSMLVLAYLALASLALPGPPPSGRVWLLPLALAVVGGLLQITCRRVLFLQLFETVGWLAVGGVFALSAERAFAATLPERPASHSGFLIMLALGLSGVVTLVARLRSPSLARMPCGPYGRPDPQTGIVRDVLAGNTEPIRDVGAGMPLVALLMACVPLAVALLRQFGRSQPVAARVLLLGVGVLGFAGFATWSAAWSLTNLVAVIRWERRYGKSIHLAR